MKRCLLLGALIVAAPAFADDNPGITISPMIGSTIFDEGIDDGTHWSIGVGYQWDNPFAVEFVYSDVGTDLDNQPVDLDFNRWHVDGLYRFNVDGNVRPYLSAGVGQGEYEYQPGLTDDETQFNIGAGLMLKFAENTAARFEAKGFNGDGNDEMNLAISLGIHHVFAMGRKSSPAPVPVAAPVDTDGDGVIDERDRCPNTPAAVSVDTNGCPLDTDGDGVYDYQDQCPGTTDRKARIDERGCYEILVEALSVELNVVFDTNSAETKPEHIAEVRRIYDFMREYPNTEVTIEGHTDTDGNADYNLGLSQRRARAIADLLIEEFGMDAARVSAVGYGETRPIASNDTAEGRQRNRRVVGVVEATVEKLQSR